MKKRNQINDKYKWDLTPLYANDDVALKQFDECAKLVNKLPSYKGKLGNPKKLLEYLELTTDIGKKLDRVVVYFHLKQCENVANKKYNEIMSIISNLGRTIGLNTSFEDDELLSYGDHYLQSLIANPKFKLYSKTFVELIRQRPHVLDEKSNQIMARVGHFAGEFSDVFEKFDAVDIKFDDALDSKGRKHKVSNSNISTLLENKDRVLRKNAFESLYKSFIAMSNTIATNYIGHVKSDVAYSHIYNYQSTLDSELFGDNINPKIYEKLVDKVNENLPLLHKFFSIRKKMLNLKDFTYYDSYIPVVKINKNPTYEEDVEIAKLALQPLGKEYVNLVDRAVKERWIDVYPTENKTTGGFCTDCYDVHPYILLNSEHTLDDLFTFVHECGHAMHSFYSNANQPYQLAGYPIVLAEIASTCNEVLLIKYLYNNATTKQEKIYYLDEYLKRIKATIYRQTMFSEFEDYAHKSIENDVPLTVQSLCEYYGNLNRKYHGKAMKHHASINYEWLRIPHFYNSYYVYKYATGLISAICLASNILNGKEGALGKYFEFLSAGGSDYPMETLKKAGVDLSTDEPYDVAFNEVKWAIDQLSKLIK